MERARADSARYGEYRNSVTRKQELTTRQSVFSYVTWQDALIRHFDATLMGRTTISSNSFFT